VLIIRRSDFINTSFIVTLCRWPSGAPVERGLIIIIIIIIIIYSYFIIYLFLYFTYIYYYYYLFLLLFIINTI
jgi:hypothetical protein